VKFPHVISKPMLFQEIGLTEILVPGDLKTKVL